MLKLSHCAVYLALSGAYSGSCFGLDKTWVSALTALLYLVLAIDEWRRHRP